MNSIYFLSDQDKNFEYTRIIEIKKAHERIDARWLLLHYKTTAGLVLFAFIVEFFMGSILIDSDMMTTIYTDYRLTSVTPIASAISIFVSEVFIVWDLDKISIFKSTARFSNFCISLFFIVAFFIACMVEMNFVFYFEILISKKLKIFVSKYK